MAQNYEKPSNSDLMISLALAAAALAIGEVLITDDPEL